MLTEDKLDEYRKTYEKNPANKILQRMVNNVGLIELIQGEDTKLSNDFSVLVPTHGVTDQKSSGRCWAFSELNILREKVIEKCDLTDFELSGSYISFYDKLEKFNLLLERLNDYKKKQQKIYERYSLILLKNGLVDGGFFTQFADLVHKYGVIPNSVFHETYSSSNTNEINQILSRLLRKYYLDLEKYPKNVEILKNEYLEKAFCIISSLFGIPPKTFNFEYTNKYGKYYIDPNLSPKEFYEKYIGLDLRRDYVEVTSYRDDKHHYNNVYELEESSRISGENDYSVLNLRPEEFQKLIIEQLKAKEPVYFYSLIPSKRIDGLWIDTMERYGEIFGEDLVLDCNSLLRTNGITNAHSMIFTGVNIVDNKITKWKVENSWGSENGNKGYYIATNEWVKRYVYRIVINKKYLTHEQDNILRRRKIKISKQDIRF